MSTVSIEGRVRSHLLLIDPGKFDAKPLVTAFPLPRKLLTLAQTCRERDARRRTHTLVVLLLVPRRVRVRW